jgi:hypothetical protein
MRYYYHYLFLTFVVILCTNCKGKSQPTRIPDTTVALKNLHDTSYTTIHVMVALCDNKYQGIAPVPAAIGNGQDYKNNLYWGCSFGIKTFFSKSNQWQLMHAYKKDSIILQRAIFKSNAHNAYIIADAYDGKYIKQCTIDFAKGLSGLNKDTAKIGNTVLGTMGNAQLLSYIGHDGLMEFDLPSTYTNNDGQNRKAIILACISKKYFTPIVKNANATPLVWTTGLMAPEAYTLHDAIQQYLLNAPATSIQKAAAAAYHKYQKCGINAANNLLVTGF